MLMVANMIIHRVVRRSYRTRLQVKSRVCPYRVRCRIFPWQKCEKTDISFSSGKRRVKTLKTRSGSKIGNQRFFSIHGGCTLEIDFLPILDLRSIRISVFGNIKNTCFFIFLLPNLCRRPRFANFQFRNPLNARAFFHAEFRKLDSRPRPSQEIYSFIT